MSDPAPITPDPAAPPAPITPAPTPDPIAPTYPDVATLVPADYKDREYLKGIKDVPDLFKKLDESQKLIGKRPAGIPQDNAKPEEIAAFNKAFGVPEKPEAYELVVPEKGAMPKEMLEGIKKVFHGAELSAKQAKKVSEGWNGLVAEIQKAAGVQAAQQDTDFTKLATEVFGEQKDQVLATAKTIIDKHVDPKMKEHINALSNENLIVLASVVESIRKQYITEDNIPGGGEGGAGGADSFEAKREAARQKMASEAYRNPLHPDHARVKAEVDAVYAAKKN